MSTPTCRPLIEALAEVPDFRKSQGKRHPLPAILALICAAMLCGYKSYGAIAEWGRYYGRDLATRLGFKDGKSPAVGTLHTVLRHLDKQALEACLSVWAQGLLQQLPPDRQLEGIAIDGKLLRGSQKQGADCAYLLSALGQRLGLTLAQAAVPAGQNERAALPEVLAALVLEGRVLTLDAFYTYPDVAQTIRAKKGTTS